MTQIEENAVFFQIEFGINAGLPFFSCRVIQKMNTGTRMIDKTSKKIFTGDFRLCGLALTVLIIVSLLFFIHIRGRITHART